MTVIELFYLGVKNGSSAGDPFLLALRLVSTLRTMVFSNILSGHDSERRLRLSSSTAGILLDLGVVRCEQNDLLLLFSLTLSRDVNNLSNAAISSILWYFGKPVGGVEVADALTLERIETGVLDCRPMVCIICIRNKK